MAAFKPVPPLEERTKGTMVSPPIHPAPWRALVGGASFDLNAELALPQKIKGINIPQEELLDLVMALIRLSVLPQIIAPALSSKSFSTGIEDEAFKAQLHETYQRHFPISQESPEQIGVERFDWIKFHLKSALQQISGSSTLKGILQVFTDVQFVRHPAFAYVSVWAALESIFDVGNEINHRVSAYIATFLEDFGAGRRELYFRCKELYKKRCHAAHKGQKPKNDELLESVVLLRRMVVKIIEEGCMPSVSEIEKRVFE